MGVYYYLYNVTQDVRNEKPIPGYGDCAHIAKMHYLDDDAMIKIFCDVIAENGWSEGDTVHACPDYPEYPIVIYEEGEIRIVNPQLSQGNLHYPEDDFASEEEGSEDEPESAETLEQTLHREQRLIGPEEDEVYDDDDLQPIRYPIVVMDNLDEFSSSEEWDNEPDDFDW